MMLAAMLMGGGPEYELPGGASDTAASGSAIATISFATDGTWTAGGNTTGQTGSGNWIEPTSLAPGSYTIRASLESGSTPGGAALDTDHALTSARSFTLTQSGAGSKTCSLTLTLKDGAGATVATQTGVTLSAQVLT